MAMDVQDVMTPTVISVEKDESLDGVLDRMRKEDVTKLPVLNGDRLVGFVSDAEIATELGALKNAGIPPTDLYATSVMVRDPPTVTPDQPVADVVGLCRSTGVPIVMVTDGNGGLSGVVTKSDLLPLVGSDRPVGELAVPAADLVTVRPDDRVVHARRLMVDHGIERLPVVDEGRLVGICAEADIAHGLAHFKTHVPVNHQKARLREFHVHEVMVPGPDLVTAEPGTTAKEAAGLMHETGVGCLPLVEDGRLVGMVTRTDLIREV